MIHLDFIAEELYAVIDEVFETFMMLDFRDCSIVCRCSGFASSITCMIMNCNLVLTDSSNRDHITFYFASIILAAKAVGTMYICKLLSMMLDFGLT